jgi:hypothetical protein
LPHDLKYPLFLIGLLIIVAGGVGGIQMGLSIDEDASIALAGFVVMFLGIILE